jgi:hypothetical protein
MSQAGQVSDDREGLPTAAVIVKAQAVLAGAEWGTARDWFVGVHEDIQMAAPRADGYVLVVTEGLDGLLQSVRVMRGRRRGTSGLPRRHRHSSFHAA